MTAYQTDNCQQDPDKMPPTNIQTVEKIQQQKNCATHFIQSVHVHSTQSVSPLEFIENLNSPDLIVHHTQLQRMWS